MKIRRAAAARPSRRCCHLRERRSRRLRRASRRQQRRLAAEIEDQKQRLPILERKLEIQQEAATRRRGERAQAHAQRLALPDRLDRRRELRPFSRHAVRRQPRLRWRLRPRDGGHLPASQRASDLRRHVRQYLRFQVHARTSGSGKTIIVDAYAAARFNPGLVVTAGKFKPSVGLERLQSEADLRFMERGLPTNPGTEPRSRRAALR